MSCHFLFYLQSRVQRFCLLYHTVVTDLHQTMDKSPAMLDHSVSWRLPTTTSTKSVPTDAFFRINTPLYTLLYTSACNNITHNRWQTCNDVSWTPSSHPHRHALGSQVSSDDACTWSSVCIKGQWHGWGKAALCVTGLMDKSPTFTHPPNRTHFTKQDHYTATRHFTFDSYVTYVTCPGLPWTFVWYHTSILMHTCTCYWFMIPKDKI